MRRRGDHVALLKFRENGGGIELRVTYWPISVDKTVGKPVGKPVESGPVDFVRG
jgi:hypothetical protein